MEDDWLRQQYKASVNFPLQGMESVVATVSGYHGSERFKLIKLISQTGASYVGAMNQSTTHLVCWKFRGRKYELARKFNMLIVNHRWVEDCIKQGRRVPEHPYLSKCGQKVGPLLLDFSLTDKASLLPPVLSNACVDFKEPALDIEPEEIDHAVWIDSSLLNELQNSSPKLDRRKSNSRRLPRKTGNKSVRRDHSSGSRYCFEEPFLSDFLRMEYEESDAPSSTRLGRQKRSSTTSAEPSRKSYRLVKKKSRDILESFSDSEQECHTIRAHHKHNEITAPAATFDGGRNGSISTVREASDDSSYSHGGNTLESMEDVEEITNLNDDVAFKDSKFHSLVENPQDDCLIVDDDINDIEHITRLSTSTELSCVICWTNFSSTRGVLPCGHRFCFPCIQSWADHMRTCQYPVDLKDIASKLTSEFAKGTILNRGHSD
ncbi:unnamed protein product [Ilex paraguariensis]|uniref:RING-type E3 ubiquitin transferase BRCA1 n=1 Tax=Ilex paraguariensis TaxID=185542 RepID=A0ABC8TH31_9AQUA